MRTYSMRNKYYERELQKQFGISGKQSMKSLISYLRSYYDWFYESGHTKQLFSGEDNNKKMLHEMLLNNVYNNFLYNRNMVNDPIMEQIHGMKLIEDERERNRKELDLLEEVISSDQQVDIVDLYMNNLQPISKNTKIKRGQEMIDISNASKHPKNYKKK